MTLLLSHDFKNWFERIFLVWNFIWPFVRYFWMGSEEHQSISRAEKDRNSNLLLYWLFHCSISICPMRTLSWRGIASFAQSADARSTLLEAAVTEPDARELNFTFMRMLRLLFALMSADLGCCAGLRGLAFIYSRGFVMQVSHLAFVETPGRVFGPKNRIQLWRRWE